MNSQEGSLRAGMRRAAPASQRGGAASAKENPAWSGKVDPRIFGQIVRDKRFPHGAFHLWHLLLDHANHEVKAWPSQRTISREMGCHISSIKGWTKQLVDAGYLTVRKEGARKHCVYYLALNPPTLPSVTGQPHGAESSHTKPSDRAGNCTTALLKTDTPGVAENSNVTKPKELIPITKSDKRQPEAAAEVPVVSPKAEPNYIAEMRAAVEAAPPPPLPTRRAPRHSDPVARGLPPKDRTATGTVKRCDDQNSQLACGSNESVAAAAAELRPPQDGTVTDAGGALNGISSEALTGLRHEAQIEGEGAPRQYVPPPSTEIAQP